MLDLVEVAGVDSDVIRNAIYSDFCDFEDAVQIYTGIKSKVDFIVTRNPKDFKNELIKVLTPEEIIKKMS